MIRKLFHRKSARIAAITLIACGLTASIVLGIWWARYPKTPDPNNAPFAEATRFIGTPEFNELTERHRKQYVLTVIERTRKMAFKDLVAMMTTDTDNRKLAAENVKLLPESDRDEIGARMMGAAMDSYFSQSAADRQAYLMFMALAEKAAKAASSSTKPSTQPAGTANNGKPKRPGQVPTPEQLEKEAAKFLSHQSPKTVAQMSQFMLDIRRTRKTFGLE